jgi:hypothetical protein
MVHPQIGTRISVTPELKTLFEEMQKRWITGGTGVVRLQDQVPPRLAETGTMLSLSREEVYIYFAYWPHNGYT